MRFDQLDLRDGMWKAACLLQALNEGSGFSVRCGH